MKLRKLKDVIKSRGLKCLVYGDAGAGKTRLIGTLPGSVLIISAEAGLLSLKPLEADGRFDVVEIENIDDLRGIYKSLKSGAIGGYDWIVLDSITEIAEVVLAYEKKQTKDPRQAYGQLIDQMGEILRGFRDLPTGIYFSAKQAADKDESTGRVSYGVSMPGSKVGAQVPYLFDEVFRLLIVDDPDTKEAVRWLQTAKDSKSVAKDRSGMLDPYEPADLGAIADKIRNTSTEDTEDNDEEADEEAAAE